MNWKVAAALVVALAATAAAQDVPGAEGGTSGPALGDGPRATNSVETSERLAAAPARTVELPAVDPAPLLEEDAYQASVPGLKVDPRVAVLRRFRPVRAPSRLVPGTSGVETRSDGSLAWTAEFRSPGAVGLRLHVARCDLPAGAALWLYDALDPSRAYGPVDPSRAKDAAGFFLPTVFAENVRVEIRVASAAPGPVGFVVDRAAHRYRERGEGMQDPRVGIQPKAGDCENDVACQPDYSDVARAVATMEITTSSGVFLCSGCLLNDSETSTTVPYFLTAHHCLSSDLDARNTEFYFDYRAATCGGTAPALSSVPRVSGSTLLATSSTSDYTLLKLTGTIPSNRFYCGWTASKQTVGEAIVGVHHPNGGKMRISFGSLLDPDGNFHQVQWTSGVTAPGSSGSPLFNPQKQVIGQLYGGSSSCSFQNGIDEYGRFDRTYPSVSQWLGNGGDNKIVDPWDPGDDVSSGATVLDPAPSFAGAVHGPHTLSKDDLADWFQTDLSAGRRYRFFSTGTDDVKARLFLGTTLVASDNDTGGSRQFSIDFTPTTSGTYLLEVTTPAAAGAADYALQYVEIDLKQKKPPAPVQSLKRTVQGTQVALKWKDAAKNESGYYVEISTDGQTWSRVAELPRNAHSFTHGPGTGQFIYRVGAWNAVDDSMIRWKKIAVSVVDVNQLDSADPTDDAGSGATVLSPVSGGTTPQHSLSRADFEDWFRIDMTAGSTYTFQSLGTGDTYGELYQDSAGAALATADDDSGAGKNFRFSYTAPRTATFWVRVTPYAQGAVMTYQLQWEQH